MASMASLIATLLLLFSILGHCEMSIYPGLRRKPMQQTLQQYDIPSDFLAQLMEENARRRLQQQFEQQLELINMQLNRQRQLLERERYLQRQRQQELEQLAETEDDYTNNLNNQYDQYDADNIDFNNYNRNYQTENNFENVNSNSNSNNNNNNKIRYANIAYSSSSSSNNVGNGFANRNNFLQERIPFAVGPSDARFFETDGSSSNKEQSGEFDSKALDEYEEYAPTEKSTEKQKMTEVFSKQTAGADVKLTAAAAAAAAPAPVLAPAPVEPPKLLDAATTTNFHRNKPQTAAAKDVVGRLPIVIDNVGQHEINALIEKLQKESKSHDLLEHKNAAALGQKNGEQQQMVLRQHLGMDGEMGIYIIALLAGVSAAVTVGLIALGVTWLHNRTKAAADVDYPAYGITGPNKEISPSGDRKLAHSAQMYHYQHQKQQIIAMENRQCAEGSCGLSDVESDDDNEEGDYTVYECPGLAPTGEMEVKNPLFLDETPATPATVTNTTTATATAAAATTNTATTAPNITQAQPQQPATFKKSSVRTLTNLLTSSSTTEDQQKKQNKSKNNK